MDLQFLLRTLMGAGPVPASLAAPFMLAGQPAQAAGVMPTNPPLPTPAPRVPIPTPRPDSLPDGSMMPNRGGQMQLPAAGPIPPDRPMMPPQDGQVDATENPQGFLQRLLMGGAAGGDPREMLRAFGAGMRNINTAGGDPFVAFGSGFGGTTGHYDQQDQAAAAAKAAAEKTAYDRQTEAEKARRDEMFRSADLDIRKAADERAGRTSELSNAKTAVEIQRMAANNGLSVDQMLEVERVAQAAAENVYGAEERTRIIDQERKRLINDLTQGRGLSGQSPGLSGGDEVTATNPETGEQMAYRNGAWEPL